MRNIILFFIASMPLLAAADLLFKEYRAIQLLRNFRVLFEYVIFVLNSNVIEIYRVFHAIGGRNIQASFCESICDSLQNGTSFETAWEKSICMIDRDTLSAQERQELLSFSNRFGFGSIESQLQLCESFQKYCEKSIELRRQRITQNGKLYMTGSLLLGAFLFVVMS